MRKFLVPLLSFIIFSNALLAQTNNIEKWAVSYTPALVLSPRPSYGIQPGVEYRINSRLTVLTELAFSVNSEKDSSFSNKRYFRIKPELRYNFESRHRWVGSYIGLQLSYVYRKWDDLRGGRYFIKSGYDDTAISYSRATVTSPILTSSIQMGTIINIGDQFALELFLGMGARIIFTDYKNVVNTGKVYSPRPICIIFPTMPAAYTIDRTIARFHMNTGIRFLYAF